MRSAAARAAAAWDTGRCRTAALPRHLVLTGLCAGLLLGGRAPAAAVAAAGAAVASLAPRRGLAAATAVAVLAGAAFAERRVAHLEHSVLARAPGAVLTAEATLLEPSRTSPYGTSARVRLRGETVLLRDRGGTPTSAQTGDILAVTGTVRRPGEFARARGATAELLAEEVRPTGRHRRSVVDAVRRTAHRALAHGLPRPERALLRGMVLGDDSALPDAARDDVRATGLTHLVAASGANIALLAALALAVTRAVGLGIAARALAVLALIALYVPLAGGGPSIRRAGIMGAAATAALLAGRPASRGYALLLAAAGTLALDPRAAGDPGWQLSFAAVGLLLLRGRAWAARLRRAGLPGLVAEAVAVSAAATLATAPLVAAHFDRVPLTALPVNVLVAPLVAPVMWLGALAICAEPVLPAAAATLDGLAGYPLACILALAHAGARVPGAQVAAGPLPVAAACAAVVALIEREALLTQLAPGPRRRVVAGTALAAAAVAAVLAAGVAGRARPPAPPPDGRLRLTFLDVGQGDAVLAQDGPHALLVDTGPPEGDVVGRLRRAGVRRLDLLVITHAETDHAGGAAAVLRAMPVGAVLDGRDGVVGAAAAQAGGAAAARHVRRIVPDAGMVLRVGRLRLRVLSPRAEPAAAHAGGNPNDRAIVAELDAGGARVVLPADAESPVTLPLHLDGPVEVLKVAHHGSADPGLAALLAALRPGIAVVSVGAGNPFGHPTRQALDALRAVPLLLRTDRDGSVRLDRTPGGWEVRTHV